MVNIAALPGSALTTAIWAPLGKTAGGGPHFNAGALAAKLLQGHNESWEEHMAGGAMLAAAAAAQAKRIQHIIDAFRLADATAPGRARPLADIGAERNRDFDALVSDGVIVAGAGGTWYLSEAGYIARQAAMRRRSARAIFFVMALAVGLLIVAAVMASQRRA